MNLPQAFDLNPQDWATLRRLLDEALALEPPRRDAWLDALASPLDTFRPHLRELLAQAAGGTAAQQMHTLPRVETGSFAPNVPQPMPERVGPYRLLRELGRGGMATVWLAERDDMLQSRQVALKLPHVVPGVHRGLAERMAREREILASLNHPNIAQLYDAGVTEGGQPYLALEVVEGERIDAWCDGKQLDVPARLRLLLQVARAVAHAHARLVVHRDLKPSNMLVTPQGQVKLLDFGIAKILDQGEAQATELTQQVGRALTPDYAAPEQLLGTPVTTASDVYALGTVCYELLCGRRPRDASQGLHQAIEAARAPRDIAPPSARASSDVVRRALRGDLDTIVLKALEPDPGDRYATVDAFADDIERHLLGEPVRAQPDSRWYRMRKFVRRHRVAVGAVTAVVCALSIGLAGTVWQARLARTEQARAEAVKAFVTNLLVDADPYETRAQAGTVEGLLQAAADRLAATTDIDTAVRVELRTMVGGGLSTRSRPDAAADVLDRAVSEARTGLGEHHALTQRARLTRLITYRQRGLLKEAEAELRDLLPVLKSSTGAGRDALLQGLKEATHLAIDTRRPVDALAHASEAVALATELHGAAHPRTTVMLQVQASAAQFGDDAELGLRLAELARDRVITMLGTDRPHANVLDARFVAGRALGRVGRYDEAVVELSDVLAQARALLGDKARIAGFVAGDIARYSLELGDADVALRHADLMWTIVGPGAAEDSTLRANIRTLLGRALLASGRAVEARAEFERALGPLQRTLGGLHATTLEVVALHATALVASGRVDDAWSTLEPHLAAFRNVQPVAKYRGLFATGLVHRHRGNEAEAQRFFQDALAALPDMPAHGPRRRAALAQIEQQGRAQPGDLAGEGAARR